MTSYAIIRVRLPAVKNLDIDRVLAYDGEHHHELCIETVRIIGRGKAATKSARKSKATPRRGTGV